MGLNVVAQRADGYHDIETVFYPIPLFDALEIKYMSDEFPSLERCDIKITGNAVECDEKDNLVVRAYNLLAADFNLPRVHAHLYKRIPTGAGLGGGSSDAAYMIKLLDERFRLNIGIPEMERYAARLGADCAFFITAMPSFACGKGDQLQPADGEEGNLEGYHIVIVKPHLQISTALAYSAITAHKPAESCRDIIRRPIETWKNCLINDFEEPIFQLHPQLRDIKSRLYASGALYASMTGSGSAIYGLFSQKPNLENSFCDMFCCELPL